MSKLEVLKAMVEKHTGVESEADNQTEALIELLLAELGGNGGSEPFIVRIDGSEDEGFSIDKSANEILNAFANGKNIIAYTPKGIGGFERATIKGSDENGLIGHVEIGFADSLSGANPEYHLFVIKGTNVTYKSITMTLAT